MDDAASSEERLIPIGLLAAEGFDVAAVTARFAGRVTVDDVGLCCLPGSVVRAVIAERNYAAADERDREAAAREAARRRPHPTRERVSAIAAQQDQVRENSLPPYQGAVR